MFPAESLSMLSNGPDSSAVRNSGSTPHCMADRQPLVAGKDSNHSWKDCNSRKAAELHIGERLDRETVHWPRAICCVTSMSNSIIVDGSDGSALASMRKAAKCGNLQNTAIFYAVHIVAERHAVCLRQLVFFIEATSCRKSPISSTTNAINAIATAIAMTSKFIESCSTNQLATVRAGNRIISTNQVNTVAYLGAFQSGGTVQATPGKPPGWVNAF